MHQQATSAHLCRVTLLTPPPPPTPQAPEQDVTLIFSESELDELLRYAGSSKMVVLFCGLTWCRPCKGMQRAFQRLAQHYPDLACIKLFGNANDQTKRLFKDRLRVRSTPSFIFFVDGNQVGAGLGCG